MKMFSIIALHPTTGRMLGAFLCTERDKFQTEKWNKSMSDQRATLVKFKTEQDMQEWMQDRKC